jgi:hypothetical protein
MKYSLKFDEINLSNEQLHHLFNIEKRRRKVNKSTIVFLDASNLANYYWCALKSYYKSCEDEFSIFVSYLEDRIRYSYSLGLIKRFPLSKKKRLSVGKEIGLDHIQSLLNQKDSGDDDFFIETAETFIDKDGTQKTVLNPFLSEDELDDIKKCIDPTDVTVDVNDYPRIRGNFLEQKKAEKYKTIRWNAPYNQYVIIGAPDGISDNFVYEFKSTRTDFLRSFYKPVAIEQANIYAYIFNKESIRVQLFSMENNNTKTIVQDYNPHSLEILISNYIKMSGGWIPPMPKTWKCNKCDYKPRCYSYADNTKWVH